MRLQEIIERETSLQSWGPQNTSVLNSVLDYIEAALKFELGDAKIDRNRKQTLINLVLMIESMRTPKPLDTPKAPLLRLFAYAAPILKQEIERTQAAQKEIHELNSALSILENIRVRLVVLQNVEN